MPSKTEANIQKEIMLALSQAGCTVWRNNTGAYKDGNRYISYGLAVGSSDLICITETGTFMAVEVKKQGWKIPKTPSDHIKNQINFINVVKSKGGIAGFATSAEEAIRLLHEQEQKL